jgi:PAS domain S-box-containing protein
LIRDAVVATDADQKVKFLNPVAEALTGWKHEEAIGRALGEILILVSGGDQLDPVEPPVGGALHMKGPASLGDDAVLVARDGSVVPIEDAAASILGDEGEVLGGVMVFRDVTERRRAEQQIQRLNAELERRVVERTQQLEAANRELEAFSYSVAHDLRAPLRGIDGFSQALIEDHAANLGPQGLAHLGRVRRAAQRMAQIIDDLLRLARVAQADFNRRAVDLAMLARSVRAELEAANPGREGVLEIQEGIIVQGDERLLRIALENLFGNALKFTSKVAHPRIEFGSALQAGERVCFVRDNGVGFDMKYAHRLFQVFQRLHTTGEFEGTGVGLAIVERIIKRHGGRIWAESSGSQGTTFHFVV